MSATGAGSSRDELPPQIQSLSGKLVYLYLSSHGGATVDELKEALDLAQLRLYPVLESLRERGLIEQHTETYRIAPDVGGANDN